MKKYMNLPTTNHRDDKALKLEIKLSFKMNWLSTLLWTLDEFFWKKFLFISSDQSSYDSACVVIMEDSNLTGSRRYARAAVTYIWRQFFMRSIPLLMINCVITLSTWLWNHEPQASRSSVDFDNAMMQFIVNKMTRKRKKHDVNLFFLQKQDPEMVKCRD